MTVFSNCFFVLYRLQRELCLSTLTVTSHHLNQLWADSTLWFKQMNTLKTWQISPPQTRWVSPQSSILTDLPCPFSSLRCLPRRTARARRFLTLTLSFLTLTKKLSLCLMSCALRRSSKPAWRSLKRPSLPSWSSKRKNTKKCATLS